VNGALFIADRGNHRIRQVDLISGVITTIAGNGSTTFTGDDIAATSASLSFPTDMVVVNGGLFISDFGHNRVRRVDLTTGLISTAAGNGSSGLGADGPALSATVWGPSGLAADGTTVLISEESGQRVRQLDLVAGNLATIAGTGAGGFGGDGGPATSAR